MSSDPLGILEDYDPSEVPLPGLEPEAGPVSAVELAARRTIAAINADGELSEHQAVVCAMILAAARAIDKGSQSGRASAVAMAMKELREAYLLLIPASEGGAKNDDGWADFEAKFRDEAARG